MKRGCDGVDEKLVPARRGNRILLERVERMWEVSVWVFVEDSWLLAALWRKQNRNYSVGERTSHFLLWKWSRIYYGYWSSMWNIRRLDPGKKEWFLESVFERLYRWSRRFWELKRWEDYCTWREEPWWGCGEDWIDGVKSEVSESWYWRLVRTLWLGRTRVEAGSNM